MIGWAGLVGTQQNPRGTHSSRSTRIVEQVRLRLLERARREVSAYAWEVIEKFFQRVPAFDVIDQRLDRDSSPPDNRGAQRHKARYGYDVADSK